MTYAADVVVVVWGCTIDFGYNQTLRVSELFCGMCRVGKSGTEHVVIWIQHYQIHKTTLDALLLEFMLLTLWNFWLYKSVLVNSINPEPTGLWCYDHVITPYQLHSTLSSPTVSRSSTFDIVENYMPLPGGVLCFHVVCVSIHLCKVVTNAFPCKAVTFELF